MVDGSGSMEDLASPMSVALRPLLQRFAVRLQSNISSVESALEWLNRGARQILLAHDVLSPEELSQVGEEVGGGGTRFGLLIFGFGRFPRTASVLSFPARLRRRCGRRIRVCCML